MVVTFWNWLNSSTTVPLVVIYIFVDIKCSSNLSVSLCLDSVAHNINLYVGSNQKRNLMISDYQHYCILYSAVIGYWIISNPARLVKNRRSRRPNLGKNFLLFYVIFDTINIAFLNLFTFHPKGAMSPHRADAGIKEQDRARAGCHGGPGGPPPPPPTSE